MLQCSAGVAVILLFSRKNHLAVGKLVAHTYTHSHTHTHTTMSFINKTNATSQHILLLLWYTQGEKAKKVAVREAAINSALDHINIVSRIVCFQVFAGLLCIA